MKRRRQAMLGAGQGLRITWKRIRWRSSLGEPQRVGKKTLTLDAQPKAD
jgi:hypothetical protein